MAACSTIGGRVATEHFLDQLAIGPGDHVLDVGCGLGGASRFSAERYGCRVTGIDLTREYVEAGKVLNSWVGLADRIHLEQADASAIPCPEAAFDRVYMLHVGMNIADKHALASELHRVLKPGGRLGIYDVMRVGDGDLEFPVPWAGSPEGSSVARPDEYKQALDEVGFRVTMGAPHPHGRDRPHQGREHGREHLSRARRTCRAHRREAGPGFLSLRVER
jgi:ubiquinone/menaquinone biosynthesis C-methylase UbiE